MSGNVKPEDLLNQLSMTSRFQGVLSAAQNQFPQAAALIGQANAMFTQLQQGFEPGGEERRGRFAIKRSFRGTGSVAVEPSGSGLLLGDAAKQFPQASALLNQAQALASQAQEGLTQAKGAGVDALQKGDYQAALGQVTAIPAVSKNPAGRGPAAIPCSSCACFAGGCCDASD